MAPIFVRPRRAFHEVVDRRRVEYLAEPDIRLYRPRPCGGNGLGRRRKSDSRRRCERLNEREQGRRWALVAPGTRADGDQCPPRKGGCSPENVRPLCRFQDRPPRPRRPGAETYQGNPRTSSLRLPPVLTIAYCHSVRAPVEPNVQGHVPMRNDERDQPVRFTGLIV